MLRTIMNNLPAFIHFEGCTFQLVILFRENKTAQIAYIITHAEITSKHFSCFDSLGLPGMWRNPFTGKLGKELIIRDGITTEMECRLAASEIKKFLEKNLAKSLAESKKVVL